MRIGFLSHHNPFDPRAFSGTAHYMVEALKSAPGVQVEVLGRHRPRRLLDRFKAPAPNSLRYEAINESGLDWIVALASSGALAPFVERLRTPILYATDATPAFLREVYGRSIDAAADRAEARMIAAARKVVYSSRYMADRAEREFAVAPGKLAAVPFGLNFEGLPDAVPQKLAFPPLELLFIGKDWVRKGGEVALEALDALTARAVEARLSVVGGIPHHVGHHPRVVSYGYLDKGRPRQYRQLVELFRRAHVLLLPTRADCTPMVVAEANAYGIPVLVTDVGGIGSLMALDGRNGAMLPPGATGDLYADRIVAMTADPEAYRALCLSSFRHCRERLTWSAWARDLMALLHDPAGATTG